MMQKQKSKILVVEDEKSIADTLVYTLEGQYFSPHWVNSGSDAISILKTNSFDCVLLDIGLPDMNGFDILKQIRSHSEIPIIFLTARDEEIDKILGLEMGADDYITKPFSPREVVARIKTVLKRITKNKITTPSQVLFKHNSIHAEISLLNQVLALTKSEYLLLAALLKQPARVFSREQLMESIWNSNHPSDERTIDTHIKSLRAKIKIIDSSKEYIHTHRGLGYSFQS